MAWSPLAQGRVATGHIPDPAAANLTHHQAILAALDLAASDYQTDRTSIALAWLLRHPSKMVPVIGSANPDHIRLAVRAADLVLDRETWYRILLAARGVKLP